jgi:hypothetical protein
MDDICRRQDSLQGLPLSTPAKSADFILRDPVSDGQKIGVSHFQGK